MRVYSHLLNNQRPDQSGLMLGKWTTDRNLALFGFLQGRLKFRLGCLRVYVDLKKGVWIYTLRDTVGYSNCPLDYCRIILIWWLVFTPGLNVQSRIRVTFPVHFYLGERQQCVPPPSHFNTCMARVLCKVADQIHWAASVANTKVSELAFLPIMM